MSLILDALKRAERERYAGKSAMLTDLPRGLPSEPARSWRRPALIIVALLAAAAAVVYLLREPRAPSPPPAVAAAPAPREPVAAPEFVPAPAPLPGTESVSSLDELTSEPLELETYQAAEPEPAPAPAPSRRPEASAAPADPSPTPPPEAAAVQAAPVEPVPPPAAPPSAETPPPAALTRAVPMRRFRELPPELRAEFPELTIDVHVYERTPTQRFAIVNGRRYREGEMMVEGPQLMEIVRDGLVLEWRGERFLYTLAR